MSGLSCQICGEFFLSSDSAEYLAHCDMHTAVEIQNVAMRNETYLNNHQNAPNLKTSEKKNDIIVKRQRDFFTKSKRSPDVKRVKIHNSHSSTANIDRNIYFGMDSKEPKSTSSICEKNTAAEEFTLSEVLSKLSDEASIRQFLQKFDNNLSLTISFYLYSFFNSLYYGSCDT